MLLAHKSYARSITIKYAYPSANIVYRLADWYWSCCSFWSNSSLYA